MAAQSPPFVLSAGSHSAALFREAVSSLLATTGGVVGLGDLLVTQNGTPNMTVNVASGEIWIPGTSATGNDDAPQGQYFGYNDNTVNLAISAANVTNPRIDKVCATVEDAAYAGSNNDWKLQVVTGTATAGATLSNLNGAAATPANSVVIAYVLVPANATTIVTADLLDNRPFAAPNLPLRANPVGECPNTGNAGTSSSTPFTFNLAAGFLGGGMTFGSNGLIVPIAGKYHIAAFAAVNPTNAGLVQLGINKNGAGTGAGANVSAGAGAWITPALSIDLNLAAGDNISLGGEQYTGGAVTFGANTAFLSVHLVSI